MKQAVLFLCAMLTLCFAPTQAWSQNPVEDAKIYFEAGVQAYDAGEFDAAALAFEEAYRLVPKPAIMFSMAQAYRRLYFVSKKPAALQRSLELYRTYLLEVQSGGRRSDAVQHLADLEPMWLRLSEEERRTSEADKGKPVAKPVTQVMISSRTKGSKAGIDGSDSAEVPVVRQVEPGKHKIKVTAKGYYPEEVEGVAVEGRLVVIEVNLKPMPAEVSIKGGNGAEFRVDGRPAGQLPQSAPFQLEAGKHFLTIAKKGHRPYWEEVDLKLGEKKVIDPNLRATTQRKVSYWVLGSSIALFAAGATTGTMAFVRQSQANDILNKRDDGMNLSLAESEEFNAKRKERNDFRNATYFLMGGAAIAATTGILLYVIDSPEVEMRPGMTVQPQVATNGAGLILTSKF